MPTQINRRNSIYGYPTPQAGLQQEPIVAKRVPTTADLAEIGTIWVNTTTNIYYVLTSITNGLANWANYVPGALDSLTGNSGGVVLPAGDGNINVIGSGSVSVVGNPGTNTLTISNTAIPALWTIVTADTAMVAGSQYITKKLGSTLVYTLPVAAAVGTLLAVTGSSSFGWQIAQNAGQVIHFGEDDTTTGVAGSLASTLAADTVILVCTTADTVWNVVSSIGEITII